MHKIILKIQQFFNKFKEKHIITRIIKKCEEKNYKKITKFI